MKKITLVFLLALSFFFLPSSVQAVSFQSSEDLTLPQDKTFDETLVVAAKTLVVNSPINGDLYCAGQDVLINTTVAGDVICAAENIKVSGTIGGNLRLLARVIDSDAVVHSSSSLFAQTLTLKSNTQIGGDFIAAASTADLSGFFARDVAVAAKDLVYSAQTTRNATLATENLSAASSSSITGDLYLFTYTDSKVTLPESVVKGTVNRHQTEASTETDSSSSVKKITTTAWLSKQLVSALSALLLGVVLLYFTSYRNSAVLSVMKARPVASFFIGFAVLFLLPFFFFITLITIIGLQVAFLALFAYIIALMLSSVYSALYFGKLLAIKAFPATKLNNYHYLAIGVLVFWLVFAIPVLGGFVKFFTLCFGLGSYFLSFLPAPSEAKKEK